MAPLCCVPQDVVHCNIPDILDIKSAVQVICSNPFCWQSGLVHPGCFYKWEDKLVSFLVSGEREGSSIEVQVMNSLWTKQMWDLPIPGNFTGCQCGEGSLKKKFGDDELAESEVFEKKRPLFGKTDKYSSSVGDKPIKLKEECIDDVQSTNEPLEDDNWEIVSRLKSKKRISKGTKNKSPPKKKHPAPTHKAGPNPQLEESAYVPPLQPSSQAEGKRDSSGLINCCSCQTVHASLPDFIQHCKTVQHCKLQDRSATDGAGKDINNNVEEDNDIGREVVENDNDIVMEVYQLKRCLLELMKQRLEQDSLEAEKFEELRKSYDYELKKSRGTLNLLIEKFEKMEEKVFEFEEKLSSFHFKVENNEKDLESCFDCFQDLTVNMAGLVKEFKVLKKNDLVSQGDIKVKISEVQENFSRCQKRLQGVEHAKPINVESFLSNCGILVILFAGIVFVFLLANVLL